MYLGIVDADSIIYRVAYQTEDEDIDVAMDTLRGYVFENIYKPTRCEEYIFCFSGKKNFRDSIAVTKVYKGNREDKVKPKHLQELKDYAIEIYNGVVVPPYEADDLVITVADRYIGSFVLIGIDKDAKQLAGKHYNFGKNEHFVVSPKEAQYNLAMQMLTGDQVDNIQGVAGIGSVKAAKILDESHKPPMLTVYELYKERELDNFDEHLQLLRMKKDILFDMESHFFSFDESLITKELEEFDFD
jgi:hypothetical protein